jgi:hypothetical protein
MKEKFEKLVIKNPDLNFFFMNFCLKSCYLHEKIFAQVSLTTTTVERTFSYY